MRIAVLADTHLPSSIAHLGELGPEAGAALEGADLILHAGDVVHPAVLDWCEQFAPVRCSAGGHDHFDDARCARVQVLDLEGWRVGMVHDVEAVPPSVTSVATLTKQVYGAERLDVLIAGDSHYERLQYREGAVLLDPGSPVFPHHQETRLGSVALIDLERGRLRVELLPLGETPGRPNPCTAASLELRASESGAPQLVALKVGGRPVDLDRRRETADEDDTPLGWRPSNAPPLRV